MVLAIMELVADEDEVTDEQDTSTEWVSLVDRGGLWHVTNETFMFLCAIEEGLRTHFSYQLTFIWFERCHCGSHHWER